MVGNELYGRDEIKWSGQTLHVKIGAYHHTAVTYGHVDREN
jgi:hypothetical protein